MPVILCLDDCNRNICLIIDNVIRPLLLSPYYLFPADNYLTVGKRLLLPDLLILIPSGIQDCRRYKLVTDLKYCGKI